jgi:hypothetical protein
MSQYDPFNQEGAPPEQLPGNTSGVPIDETGNQTAPDNQTPATPGGNAAGDPTTPPVAPNPVEANRTNITNPTLPQGAQVNPVLQTVDPTLVQDPSKYTLGAPTAGVAHTVSSPASVTATTAKTPDKIAAEQVTASLIGKDAPQVAAEQGTVSKDALVKAQTQDGLSKELTNTLDTFNKELDAIGVDPNMTVQGQFSSLMSGFDNGGTPAWAAGAIKVANQRMAARGLSGSTMAGQAVTAAVIQEAMPIAVQDAQIFKDLKLAKLDKKAQSAFLRAGFVSQLDMTNLNNRQQAAVVNAQSFLAMDMKNLDNRQQAAVVNTQVRLQALMSDQAAINTAAQFNASSKNQVNTFYAGLTAETDRFNTSQTNAMRQYNATEANTALRFNSAEVNAMSRFNIEQQGRRDEFNTNNAVLIDQANLTYRRNINTANNAVTNQANFVNSQNLVNISNAAMGNEIQLWRDNASYTFQAGENAKDRSLQVAINGTQNAEWFNRYNTQQKGAFWSGVGNFLFNAAGNVLEDYLEDN